MGFLSNLFKPTHSNLIYPLPFTHNLWNHEWHAINFQVAGVTFENRQSILKRAYNRGVQCICFKKSTFENSPCVEVYVNNMMIGYVPQKRLKEFLKWCDRPCSVKYRSISLHEGTYGMTITVIFQNIAQKNEQNTTSKSGHIKDSAKSLFPRTYVLFDIETSCLNSKQAEIIELSALRVVDSMVVDTFDCLVCPENPLDPKSIEVHHITYAMLKDKEGIESVLPTFLDFIKDDLLLGYNIASYDLPILRRIASSLGYDLCNDYFDVFRLAKDKLSFLPSCSLSNIAAYFMIDTSGNHRALKDCEITKACYEQLLTFTAPKTVVNNPSVQKMYYVEHTSQTQALQTLNIMLQGVLADELLTEDEVMSLNTWLHANENLSGQFPYNQVSSVIAAALEDGVLEQSELNEMAQLFHDFISPAGDSINNLDISGKSIVLTGIFSYGDVGSVESLITKRGGIIKSAVSGKTDYLVVGSLGHPDWSYGNYGSKIKKAKELQQAGKSVKIVMEDEFLNNI